MDTVEFWTKDCLIIDKNESLRNAAKLMYVQDVSSLIITEGEKLGGILTERDVVKVIADGEDVDSLKVADVMTKEPVTISSKENLITARDMMTVHRIRHLPVVDDKDKVVGIVSLRDIVHILSYQQE